MKIWKMGLWVLLYGILVGAGLFLYILGVALSESNWSSPTGIARVVYWVAGYLAIVAVLAGTPTLLIGGTLLLSAYEKPGRVASLVGTVLYFIAAAGFIASEMLIYYSNWGFNWGDWHWDHVGALFGMAIGAVLPGAFIVRRLASKKEFSREEPSFIILSKIYRLLVSKFKREKRSPISLSSIYKGACENRVVISGYGLQYMAEVLSCPTCKFADQTAMKQSMPWCESPNPPDIEKNYCHTFNHKI